jgi:sec-independent protein translocase protein TatA
MLGSPVDIALVAGLALILFGPKKFPEIGKALGQGLGNFKRALSDAQEEVQSAVKPKETSASSPAKTEPANEADKQQNS